MKRCPRPSMNRYKRHDCRCPGCVTIYRAYELDRKRHRLEAFANGRANPTHGLPSTYINYGCRCDDCTAAAVRRVRDWEARREAS